MPATTEVRYMHVFLSENCYQHYSDTAVVYSNHDCNKMDILAI